MKYKQLNIGTLNVRGSRDELKMETITKDAATYNLQILGITETHVKEESSTKMVVKLEQYNKTYIYYNSGIMEGNTYSGVGVLIDADLESKVTRVTDRICTCEVTLEGEKKIVVVVAYAPTLIRSENCPELVEKFYEILNNTVNKVKSRHPLFVIGDFNAKTGSGFREYTENMGRHGKGKINSNGKHLLDFAKVNKLYLTNTHFKHRMSHRTTWTAAETIKDRKHFDGTIRKNPYRNQIDYILTKTADKALIINSRSYAGFDTNTDHKMVITNMRTEWWRKKSKSAKSERINFNMNPETKKEYQEKVKDELAKRNIENEQNPNSIWKAITETCRKSAKETYGISKGNKKRHADKELEEMSKQQKKLKLQVESSTKKEERRRFRKERNTVLKNIKARVKVLEDTKYEEELKEIEGKKDEQRAYAAVRMLKSKKPKKPLFVTNDKNQRLNSEEDQAAEITKYFKSIFEKDDVEEFQYPPCKLENPFTADEIEKNANKLKNNKSPNGPDNMAAEELKNSPPEVYEYVAKIYNLSAESEEYASILQEGILTPLQKPPNKKKKPVENLRPVTLLSVLRKVLATCMIERTWHKFKDKIPVEQAAYQKGRSTTEQVFTMKTLAEKAINSEDYSIFILLIDMSKAFDTVNRKYLMEHLSKLLSKSEMRLIYLLVAGGKLRVRVGDKLGEYILTNTGVLQGDCLSAILFIFYLQL